MKQASWKQLSWIVLALAVLAAILAPEPHGEGEHQAVLVDEILEARAAVP